MRWKGTTKSDGGRLQGGSGNKQQLEGEAFIKEMMLRVETSNRPLVFVQHHRLLLVAGAARCCRRVLFSL